MRTMRTVRALVEFEPLEGDNAVLTLRHPKHGGQFVKIRIEGGAAVIARGIHAVYDEQAGDADAFFLAHGMSDAEAFGNPCPWSKRR
jgi:hypothetical protein